MDVFSLNNNYKTYLGDCREVLKTFPENFIDSICEDPPSGTGIMGLEWDNFTNSKVSQTQSKSMIEAKSDYHKIRGTTVASQVKAKEPFIEFMTEVFKEEFRVCKPGSYSLHWALPRTCGWTQSALENAGFYVVDFITHLFATGRPKGLNTLKPSCEFWILARKPTNLSVVENYKKWGVGGLNIESSRVGKAKGGWGGGKSNGYMGWSEGDARPVEGKWPSHLLLDSFTSEMVKDQKGDSVDEIFQIINEEPDGSLFLFASKPNEKERIEGLDERNPHKTLKGQKLMKFLTNLITPSNGICLDSFGGSFSTGVACIENNLKFIGIELEKSYYDVGVKRLQYFEEKIKWQR